ncbi:MAG: putative acetyltransferase protein [Alphaproteobacteria bacterium]|nr:MAG: putative acetyltransferase protein [Caulobacteraceae bacterium]TPW08949.1 MAG: putative acetyltransferase protein [Alphaproteobacteria bacterium]
MFRIRRALPSDADVACRFTMAAAQEDGSAPSSFSPDLFRRDATGANSALEIWIAEDMASRPCGQAIACRGYDLHHAMPTMELLHLYVLPEHRRDGLARMLIAEVANRAMDLGARELTITTGVDNAVARRFFAAIGAREDRLARYLIEPDGIEWLAAEAQ